MSEFKTNIDKETGNINLSLTEGPMKFYDIDDLNNPEWLDDYNGHIKANLIRMKEIRDKESILKDFIIPNWSKYEESILQNRDQALQESIFLIAYMGQYLGRIITPLSKYLSNPSKPIRKQYKNDLKEVWMSQKDPIKRLEKTNIFIGKITELCIASWLEEDGFQVTDLAAWSEGASDIAGNNNAGEKCFIEIKYFGIYKETLKSMMDKKIGWFLDIKSAWNWMLYKALEGTKQLKRYNGGKKILILAIEKRELASYAFALEEGRINWGAPSFIDKSGCDVGRLKKEDCVNVAGDVVWDQLKESGFIDAIGKIMPKFSKLNDSQELTLLFNMEQKKRIYQYMQEATLAPSFRSFLQENKITLESLENDLSSFSNSVDEIWIVVAEAFQYSLDHKAKKSNQWLKQND